MAYQTNRFCWHGLISTDTERAAAFYPEAIGWKTLSVPMGDDQATMFVANGEPFAHYMSPPMEGVPSHWINYLRVDDVDQTVESAVANGGKVLAPGTDIPVGRFAVLASPSGAALAIFHEANEEESEHHPGGLGSVHWVELHSTALDKDLGWLKKTFGFTTEEMPMPNDMTYTILKDGDEPRGGAMAAMFDGAPAMWLTWFEVDDADAALGRVTNNGGKAMGEVMEMDNVGRMAVVADPTGAVFGVIKPAEK